MEKYFGIIWTVLTGVISLTCVIALLKFKSDQQGKDSDVLAGKVDSLVDDLHELVSQLGIQQVASQRFSEEVHELAEKVDGLCNDLHGLVKQMGIAQAEQSVINKMCTKALDGLISKVEKLSEQVAEAKTDIRVLKRQGSRGE